MKVNIRAQQLHVRDEHMHTFWNPGSGFSESALARHRKDMRVLRLAQGEARSTDSRAG